MNMQSISKCDKRHPELRDYGIGRLYACRMGDDWIFSTNVTFTSYFDHQEWGPWTTRHTPFICSSGWTRVVMLWGRVTYEMMEGPLVERRPRRFSSYLLAPTETLRTNYCLCDPLSNREATLITSQTGMAKAPGGFDL